MTLQEIKLKKKNLLDEAHNRMVMYNEAYNNQSYSYIEAEDALIYAEILCKMYPETKEMTDLYDTPQWEAAQNKVSGTARGQKLYHAYLKHTEDACALSNAAYERHRDAQLAYNEAKKAYDESLNKKCLHAGCELKPCILREITKGGSKIVTNSYYLCEKHYKGESLEVTA